MWAGASLCIYTRSLTATDGAKGEKKRGTGHRLRTRGTGSSRASISQCRTPWNPKILNVTLAYQVVSKVHFSR